MDICRRKMQKVCEAESKYMELPLEENERLVIDEMLDLRMEADGCELTLTYLSGLIDGLEFLVQSGIASDWEGVMKE